MNYFAIAVAATALLYAPVASAQDEAGTATTAAPELRPEERRSDGDVSASLHVSTGLLATQDDEQKVLRTNLTFGLQLNYRDILFITPFIGTNSTTVDLTRPDGQPFNATLVLPWQVSLGGRIDVRFLRYRWFNLGAYGAFEFPTSTNEARVTDIQLMDDASDIMIDSGTVRDHVVISHDWRRFDIGLTARADVGIWHPFLDLGYVHMPGTLTVRFDEYAGNLLDQAEVHPAPSYDAGFSTFFYSLGSDFDLGDSGFRIRVRGTAAPIDNGWIFTGEAGLMIPLDPRLWGSRR